MHLSRALASIKLSSRMAHQLDLCINPSTVSSTLSLPETRVPAGTHRVSSGPIGPRIERQIRANPFRSMSKSILARNKKSAWNGLFSGAERNGTLERNCMLMTKCNTRLQREKEEHHHDIPWRSRCRRRQIHVACLRCVAFGFVKKSLLAPMPLKFGNGNISQSDHTTGFRHSSERSHGKRSQHLQNLPDTVRIYPPLQNYPPLNNLPAPS